MKENKKTLIGVIAVGAMFCLLPFIDSLGQDALQRCLTRTLAAFAVTRSVDAIVSSVQGTEVAANFGVGVTLSPGNLLDPLNDLLEQLSGVLTWSLISLGLQRTLLSVLGSTALMVTFAVVLFLSLVWHRIGTKHLSHHALTFVITLVVLRIGAPIIPAATVFTSTYVLGLNEKSAIDELVKVEAQVQAAESPVGESRSISEKVSGVVGFFGSPLATTKEKLGEYKKFATSAAEHCVDLMVIFLIETVGLPLLFLWLGRVLLRAALPRRRMSGSV